MTTTEFFADIAQISRLLFVITSLLTMGLSLRTAQIREPMRSARLIVLALVANFVLVPLLGYAILSIIPLEQSLRNGLIVLSLAAGAPFIPKLVQNANGDLALGVGLTMLLMAASVIYLPIILPRLLTGVQVSPWNIAEPLVELMLLPLIAGLLVHSRWPHISQLARPVTGKISTVALVVLVAVSVGLNASNLFNLFVSGRIVALLLLIIGSLLIGTVLGGRNPSVRRVMGLATATRNGSAALAVIGQNFPGTPTLAFIVVAAVLDLLILLPVASWFSRRNPVASPASSIGAE